MGVYYVLASPNQTIYLVLNCCAARHDCFKAGLFKSQKSIFQHGYVVLLQRIQRSPLRNQLEFTRSRLKIIDLAAVSIFLGKEHGLVFSHLPRQFVIAGC